MLDTYTDTTLDVVLLVFLAISLLITIKIWLERQAIRRGGRVPTGGSGLYPFLVVILSPILILINA